jgi:hypothetical protein
MEHSSAKTNLRQQNCDGSRAHSEDQSNEEQAHTCGQFAVLSVAKQVDQAKQAK